MFNKRTNLILIGSVLLVLSLLLGACGQAAAPAPAAPAEDAAAPEAEETAAEEPAAEVPAAESKYKDAPILAEMVAAGELPVVDERLPKEPLVQEVVEDIGQYGGTLRRGFTGPGDHNNYTRVTYDALVRHAPDGGEVIPHIAKGWESNDDFTQWKVMLREGMKWSDGEPFTADDILFWYEHIMLNEDLSPNIPVWMQNADGSAAQVEKVDDTTVQWTFGQPNTAFLLDLANKDAADRAISNLAFAPAHYLEQFHPAFVEEMELQAKVDEAGFETWVELFAVESMPHLSGNRPSTAAWVPDGTTVADEVFRIKRNPYYFAVDSEGNQLPYIDEVAFTFFADRETLNLAAVGGEIDMQGRHVAMSNYPVLIENAEKGGYRVVTYPTFGGSDAILMFNQTYVNEPAIGELLQNKDFRIAMSHAIDREAIKELAFLGLGEARQGVPAPFHPYYPGDEYAFKYTENDPEQANEILDGIGLTERDNDGFRLLPNGERLDLEIGVVPEQFAAWPDIGQLIVEDWAEVGVRAHLELRDRNLHFAMRDTSDLQIEIWNEDTTGFPFSGQPKFDPRSQPGLVFAPLMRQWINTDGAEGIEPTPEIQRLMDIIDEAKISGRDRQIELAHELFQIWADNIWQIGTVGLTPMVQGVVVVNADLHNVPEVAGNDWPLRTPGNTRPEQYFYSQ